MLNISFTENRGRAGQAIDDNIVRLLPLHAGWLWLRTQAQTV